MRAQLTHEGEAPVARSAGRRTGRHDYGGARDSEYARDDYEELRPSMNDANSLDIHRRTFLRYGLSGLGLLGLNSLMAEQQGSHGAGSHGAVNPLHYPAKAKRVIFLYQAGGPSHLETFDHKPKLAELHGKGDAGVFHEGAADRAVAGQAADLFRTAARVQEVRQERAWRFAICSRTSAAWPTMSASFVRCGPSRSITIRRTRS